MPYSTGGHMRRQLELNLCRGKKGGRRPGAGRKRIHSPGVAHRKREKVHFRHPLHVNFKLRASIRNKHCLKLLKRAINNSRSHGLKVIHFSLQSNHVHLILEATNNAILTKGMRSLTITFAKGMARGRLQLERYHLHVLRSLRETRNAVHYVLFNEQKHQGLKKAYIDQYSSLGLVKELQTLARNAKMTIVFSKIQSMNFLDAPSGWMIKQALNQQIQT
jgi:REP element-mobilizing transposase RayT